MRTTIIPAQITTVEDRIVGNLTVQQVFILAVPFFWAMLVYIILPPQTQLAWYKVILVIFVLLICLILSLRIKGKVVINWLTILLRYNLRPRYFVFNKNDLYLRDIGFTKQTKHKQKHVLVKKEIAASVKKFNLQDFADFIHNPKYSFSLKPNKKGGFYVAFSEK